MSKFLAWPFLISRNQSADYRVILAPDFMVETEQAQLISRWTQNQNRDKIVVNKTTHSTHGPLSIAFRHSPAKTRQNEIVRDKTGRPITWVEGLVIKGDIEDHLVPAEILNRMRPQLDKTYQEFWASGTQFNTLPSAAMEVTLPFDETIEAPNTITNEGFEWRSTTKKKMLDQLLAERKQVNQNFIIGIVLTLISVPLLAVVIGFITLPIGLWMSVVSYKKRAILDVQLEDHKK